MRRTAIAAALLACCCLFPLLSFAKVGNGYIDTGARLFELDGKPAVIFKSWYVDDTLVPCDFVFTVATTSTPKSLKDWQVCTIDRSAQMSTGCYPYDDLSVATVAGLPAYAQYVEVFDGYRYAHQVRFVQAKAPLPEKEVDWCITAQSAAEWSDCDLTIIDNRPAVAFITDSPSSDPETLLRALRVTWAKTPTPSGAEDWSMFDLASVGQVIGLSIVGCEGKPTVFFLGGRAPEAFACDMYVAQLEPTSSKWAVVRLPNSLRPSQDLWSAKDIRGQVFFAFFQGDWLMLAQADESQVLDPGSWRVSRIVDNPGSCKPKIAGLNGLPAIAFISKEGITLARAKALAPQDQNDWTLTSLHFFSEDFSLAEIAGKPAIFYIEHGGRSGALRYAYLSSESPGTAEKWHASTIFAGWQGRPDSPSRTAAADPMKAVVINTSSNARTIPLTSPLRDPARYRRLLALSLSILVILAVVIAVVAVYRRHRHQAA